MSDPDHVRLMEAVARHFFGEPNVRMSKKHKLRFGTNGSKSVDLKKGVDYDHENREGGDAITSSCVNSASGTAIKLIAGPKPRLLGQRSPG